MKRYELEAMNKAELIEHAKVAGIEVDSEETKMTMIDRIMGDVTEPIAAKDEGATIRMQKDARDIPVARPNDPSYFTLDGKKIVEPMYEVEIFSTEGDKSDVHLILNGYNKIVQRGKKVKLGASYVEILKNARIDTVRQDPDTGEMSNVSQLVYPHQATLLAA